MEPDDIPVIDIPDTEINDIEEIINSPNINSPNINSPNINSPNTVDQSLVDQSLIEPLLTEPEPEINNTPPPPIIIPLNLLNLLGGLNNVPVDHENTLEEQIANRSFHDKPTFKQVCSKDFINSLSVQKVSPELVKKKITCGVCLEELELGEDVIELPCKDKHYFHIKRENCDGIYPWLKENNTCPMCRCEFPSMEVKVKQEQQTRTEIPPIQPINLHNIINQAIEEHEERMLQEAIMESMR
jgi:hypothetical protein